MIQKESSKHIKLNVYEKKKKKRDLLLYPAWLTNEQVLLLKKAEKGLCRADLHEKLKKVHDGETTFKSPRLPRTPALIVEISRDLDMSVGKTIKAFDELSKLGIVKNQKWDGHEDMPDMTILADVPMNRVALVFVEEYGPIFGLALYFRFVDYAKCSKSEAEERTRNVMSILEKIRLTRFS